MSSRAQTKVIKKKVYPNKELKNLTESFSKNDIIKMYTSLSLNNYEFLLRRYEHIQSCLLETEGVLDQYSVARQKKHKKALVKFKLTKDYSSIPKTSAFMSNPRLVLDSYNTEIFNFLIYENIRYVFELEDQIDELLNNRAKIMETLLLDEYTISLKYMIIKLAPSDLETIEKVHKQVKKLVDALVSPISEHKELREQSSQFIMSAIKKIFTNKPNTRELFEGLSDLIISEIDANYKSYLRSSERTALTITILLNVLKNVEFLIKEHHISPKLINNSYQELKVYGILDSNQLKIINEHAKTDSTFKPLADLLENATRVIDKVDPDQEDVQKLEETDIMELLNKK